MAEDKSDEQLLHSEDEEQIETVKDEQSLAASASASASVNVIDDPIYQSYRSIINVINRTSNGFKEGKKWKCVADQPDSSPTSKKSKQSSQNKKRKKHKHIMTHSKTTDENEMRPLRGRRLVRQKATNDDMADSEEQLLASSSSYPVEAEIIDERQGHSRSIGAASGAFARIKGLPARQWTVDTCTGIQETGLSSGLGSGLGSGHGSTAYLIRPVSRSSVISPVANPGDLETGLKRTSPSTAMVAKFSGGRSPLRLASFNQSMDSSGTIPGCSSRRMERSSLASAAVAALHHPTAPLNKRHLIKQRTSESAPTNPAAHGGSARYLPRQHSNASAYSATIMPTSYSHQGITLVRGASCSLVDIPTYLGPSVAATGGVEVAQMCEVQVKSLAANLNDGGEAGEAELAKQARPRLQLDLTKKKKKLSQDARKTQWTVLCVSLTLLTLSVTLVGFMLSLGSQYQEMIVQKHWDALKNHSLSRLAATEEPFVIFPNDLVLDVDDGSQDSGTTTTNQTLSSFEDMDRDVEIVAPDEVDLVPIIFPPLISDPDELLKLSKQHHKKAKSKGKSKATSPLKSMALFNVT